MPHFRPKRNPATMISTASPASFPYASPVQSLELVRWALRDYFEAVAGAGIQLILFQLFTVGQGQPFTPQGAAAPTNKNKFHTNVQLQNGGLPNPQSMLVSSIRKIIREDIYYTDFLNLQESTLATLQCGDMQRIYFEGLFAEIPGAQAGIEVGFVTAGDITTGSLMHAGWSTVDNRYSLQTGLMDPNINAPDLGVVINEGRAFQFLLDPTLDSTRVSNGWTTIAAASSGTGVAGWVLLDGVLARSLAG